jgi:mRNA interferase RelE/StbE
MFRIQFIKESAKDWDKLDNSVKLELKKNLQPLLQNPIVESSRLKGDLSDCYRIRAPKSGYRLIYKVENEALVILVIAVGKREDEEVYRSAAIRMGRMDEKGRG